MFSIVVETARLELGWGDSVEGSDLGRFQESAWLSMKVSVGGGDEDVSAKARPVPTAG